jgi:hydrogenase-4 component B
MRAPMIALAVGCAGLGLAPVLVWPALARAVHAWSPGGAPAVSAAPLATLGFVHLGLAVVLAAAAAILWRRAHALGLRRAPTWDCGYAAPTARMQYSGGSFAGLASAWFAPVLRPERRSRRPRGVFPAGALRLERVPETVLEYAVRPIAIGVLWVSTQVRRLQHGRLQFYIAYVGVGVAALGALVLLEGQP